MVNNPYPIQIKKRILCDLLAGFIWLIVFFLFLAILSLKIGGGIPKEFAIYSSLGICFFMILTIIWHLLYLHSIEYALDDNNFTFRCGVIARSEKVLPYSKIQHAIIYESFWQRIFGLSSVSIETARESGFALAGYRKTYYRADYFEVISGVPLIPDLNKEDAEKLKNYIISISNEKYKSVAGV